MEYLENRDYAGIRGFNYFPGYARHGIEIWYYLFDPAAIEREVANCRKHFPESNALRVWLSHEAFLRNPDQVTGNFNTFFTICRNHGFRVIPTLFNGCQSLPDFGAISNEQLYGFGRTQFDVCYQPYLDAVVGGNAGNETILLWDLCNEPFNNSTSVELHLNWLGAVYRGCKKTGTRTPLAVGVCPSLEQCRRVEPISDVLTFHPYYAWNFPEWEISRRENVSGLLDAVVALANAKGKALLASECCWGALDDAKRGEVIAFELGGLQARHIGFLPCWLNYSLAMDCHREADGPVAGAGYMGFINRDGSLRPHHGIYRDFCGDVR